VLCVIVEAKIKELAPVFGQLRPIIISIINGSFGPTVQHSLLFFSLPIFFFWLWHAENFMTSFVDHQARVTQNKKNYKNSRGLLHNRLLLLLLLVLLLVFRSLDMQYLEFHAAATIAQRIL